MKKGLALAGAGLFFCLAVPMVVAAPSAPPLDERRDELKSLREQIRSLQTDISKGEEDRGEAADQLADSERAISGAQRRLREIVGEKQAVEAEVKRLRAEHDRLDGELAEARKQLGTTLYRIYVEGGEAGARRMLGGKDPNQMSRDAYYLQKIAEERAAAIQDARLALVNLQRIQADAEARREQLLSLEAERGSEQRRLLDERAKRKTVLVEVAERVSAQRREMQTLQRSQVRLEKLLVGLERIAREQAAKEARARELAAAAAARAAASSSAARASAQSSRRGEARSSAQASSEGAPRRAGIADRVAEAGAPSADFAQLQGRLRWPVKGELFGRFGAPRSEGGQWRGVFIRAAEGSEVRAVADGKVAYADWLRGFGNLIIVDHGNGYMTIYGNNDSLYKNPGQAVRTGEAIASVGASGGQEESGLYFEIRHRGQPTDPSKWVAAK
ncbi:peptidoglycan DD-metalloendopeptidase family protein [Uliginosibacterium sp. H3]|uniref:Peptidoglycan DD-metalloendopeptidase family protein n=1 Tax=Uliginosibacterium silvisoli TaxID=3114758 RepID=A0ABU6K6X8_9RHOO|nr:peptidoglycan DD-metalloendopeptidase family protein [Uliginosibacterium sp. H3]